MPMGRMYRAPAPTGARKGLNFKQVKQVQKIINKNLQIKTYRSVIAVTSTTAGSLIECTSISEGDNFNERDGDKIKVQSLKIPYSICPDTTNAIVHNVRVMVVRGKYGPLVVGDLPTTVTGQADLDKMQVYHDKLYQLIDNQDALNDNVIVPFYKSFKNKKVPHLLSHFDDSVSATACQSNPIYFFTIASSSTTPCVLAGFGDLKFFNAN